MCVCVGCALLCLCRLDCIPRALSAQGNAAFLIPHIRNGILLHTGEWPGWAPPAIMPNSAGTMSSFACSPPALRPVPSKPTQRVVPSCRLHPCVPGFHRARVARAGVSWRGGASCGLCAAVPQSQRKHRTG